MNTIDKQLKHLKACPEAINWAKGKTWWEIYNTCNRADWLLWLFNNTNKDHRLLTLAIGYCANTVRHLIKEESDIKCVDDAIAYGEGKTEEVCFLASAVFAIYHRAINSVGGSNVLYVGANIIVEKGEFEKELNIKNCDIIRECLPIGIWNVKFD
jgi:hypothetical protein